MEVRKRCQIKISKSFAVFKNVYDSEEINRA